MYDFQRLPEELILKIKRIKVLITDVDGVLTDGGIILDDQGMEYKRFQVKDGQIIPYLQENGIKVGAITGRNVEVVKRRCEQMGMDFHFHGVRDKLERVKATLEGLGLDLGQCAYIGDDLIDLEVLSQVGLSVTPSDALPYVKQRVDFICTLKGGKGAFRELADTILRVQGKLDKTIGQFLEKKA